MSATWADQCHRPRSLAFLQRVTTNDVSKLSVRQSHSMICTPAGRIKDDVFIYHVKPYGIPRL